jgi:hypothetical protein
VGGWFRFDRERLFNLRKPVLKKASGILAVVFQAPFMRSSKFGVDVFNFVVWIIF